MTIFESVLLQGNYLFKFSSVKDKAQVLLQVDELTSVKDELTDQVRMSFLFKINFK